MSADDLRAVCWRGECRTGCAYDPHCGMAKPAPTPPTTVQADRDAGQVRLTEIVEADGWQDVEIVDLLDRATEAIAWGLLEATSDTADRPPGKEAHADARATAGRILAARQSDPDATEREALAKALTGLQWTFRANFSPDFGGWDWRDDKAVQALAQAVSKVLRAAPVDQTGASK